MPLKTLKDLSWQVTEEEYRKDPALSYSTLSKYEREGRFDALPTLFESVSTPSLTFGSMVDSLLLGEPGEFEDRFVVAQLPGITDALKEIADKLFIDYGIVSFDDIPDDVLASVGAAKGYYAADKFRNYRIKQIRENCKEYFNLRRVSVDKEMVSLKDFEDAKACVNAIKTAPGIEGLFIQNPFNSDVEVFHQLKFKATVSGVDYRCMMDSCAVDHISKIILPVDLKTSSKPEWLFFKSFTEWRYDLQSVLYAKLLKETIAKDEFYKDYKVADYIFVVVNRRTLRPLKWTFPYTHAEHGWKYVTPWRTEVYFRSPFEIGQELKYYLQFPQEVPVGIDKNGNNNIIKFLESK